MACPRQQFQSSLEPVSRSRQWPQKYRSKTHQGESFVEFHFPRFWPRWQTSRFLAAEAVGDPKRTDFDSLVSDIYDSLVSDIQWWINLTKETISLFYPITCTTTISDDLIRYSHIHAYMYKRSEKRIWSELSDHITVVDEYCLSQFLHKVHFISLYS